MPCGIRSQPLRDLDQEVRIEHRRRSLCCPERVWSVRVSGTSDTTIGPAAESIQIVQMPVGGVAPRDTRPEIARRPRDA